MRNPKVSFTTFEELLSRDLRVIEQGIIDILIDIRQKQNLSYSSQNLFLCTNNHFFSINDVTINRKKLKKFMLEAENKYQYRSYTAEEISRLLDISDERESCDTASFIHWHEGGLSPSTSAKRYKKMVH